MGKGFLTDPKSDAMKEDVHSDEHCLAKNTISKIKGQMTN